MLRKTPTPPKASKKKNFTICMDAAVKQAGAKLAHQRVLSFSAMLERLVRREARKAGLLPAKQVKAAKQAKTANLAAA